MSRFYNWGPERIQAQRRPLRFHLRFQCNLCANCMYSESPPMRSESRRPDATHLDSPQESRQWSTIPSQLRRPRAREAKMKDVLIPCTGAKFAMLPDCYSLQTEMQRPLQVFSRSVKDGVLRQSVSRDNSWKCGAWSFMPWRRKKHLQWLIQLLVEHDGLDCHFAYPVASSSRFSHQLARNEIDRSIRPLVSIMRVFYPHACSP
jgi:hypothetical protein